MSNDPATAKAFQDWPALASDPSVGPVVNTVVGDAIRRGDIASADPAPLPPAEPAPPPAPRRQRP